MYICLNYKRDEIMDIGDFGFLIIAFIVFIVNFFVKANKDKTNAQAEKQKPARPELPEPWEVKETLPPLFDYSFNREKKVEVVKKKTSRPAYSSLESYDKTYKRLPQEGMSSLSESLYKEDEMENIIYRNEDTSDISYTEELFRGNITEEMRKAIIYSEILHRKYE